MAIPKPSVESLIAKYLLEPTIRDVYVEGSFDLEVVQRCLQAYGCTDRVVYEIGAIDVADSLLAKYNLTNGNKQRVIALAHEMQAGGAADSCRCLVDRDLDFWTDEMITVPTLAYTHYSSMELYFFSEQQLREIVVVGGRVASADWVGLLDSIVRTLKSAFAMRLADFELELRLRWLDLETNLTKVGDRIEFDESGYLIRVLNTNNRFAKKAEFEEKVKQWLQVLNGDPRQCIRGRDLTSVLAWLIRRHGIQGFGQDIILQRYFVVMSSQLHELSSLIQQ